MITVKETRTVVKWNTEFEEMYRVEFENGEVFVERKVLNEGLPVCSQEVDFLEVPPMIRSTLLKDVRQIESELREREKA